VRSFFFMKAFVLMQEGLRRATRRPSQCNEKAFAMQREGLRNSTRRALRTGRSVRERNGDCAEGGRRLLGKMEKREGARRQSRGKTVFLQGNALLRTERRLPTVRQEATPEKNTGTPVGAPPVAQALLSAYRGFVC
jgi:hypothetical protein